MVLIFWATAFSSHALAQRSDTRSEVIAAYLFNFSKFVDWDKTLTTPPGKINICSLGDSDVNHALSQYQGRRINGRTVEVLHFRNVRFTTDCQVLFFATTESRVFERQLENIQGGILTVSAIEKFSERGGMIELYMSDGRIAFSIDNNLAKDKKVFISSKLLRLSRKPNPSRQANH